MTPPGYEDSLWGEYYVEVRADYLGYEKRKKKYHNEARTIVAELLSSIRIVDLERASQRTKGFLHQASH